jgi:hypothetical protein
MSGSVKLGKNTVTAALLGGQCQSNVDHVSHNRVGNQAVCCATVVAVYLLSGDCCNPTESVNAQHSSLLQSCYLGTDCLTYHLVKVGSGSSRHSAHTLTVDCCHRSFQSSAAAQTVCSRQPQYCAPAEPETKHTAALTLFKVLAAAREQTGDALTPRLALAQQGRINMNMHA